MSLCRWTAAGHRHHSRLTSHWPGPCLHWVQTQPGEDSQQPIGNKAGAMHPALLPCATRHVPHMQRLRCTWPSAGDAGVTSAATGDSQLPRTHAGLSTLPAAAVAAQVTTSVAGASNAAVTATATAVIEQEKRQQQAKQLPAEFLLPVPGTPTPHQHEQTSSNQNLEQHHSSIQQQQQQQQQQQNNIVPHVATATAVQLRPGIAPWISTIALCGTAAAIMYGDRSSISTAILPMSEQFGWDKRTGGAVMSAFLCGYGATQITGGQLSDRYGGRAVLAGGLALWSLATLLTPAAAAHSAGALLATRVVLGLGQGVAFPAIHSMIARGVPKHRRSRAIGAVMACAFAGSALAFGASPVLISTLGWPYVFYSFSVASGVWLIAALAMRRKSGPRVQQTNMQQHKADASQQQQQQQQQATTTSGFSPLLRRKEVWAIAATQYGSAWGFCSLLAWLPTFFSEHHGVQLAELGGYTIMPYLLQGCVAASAGLLAERLLNNGWRVRSVRVGMQTAAMLGPAACTMAAVSPLAAASPTVAVALITAGMGMSALACNGVSANHLDIAPNNSGKVFGIGNAFGTVAGILSVPATGALLHATGSWPLVFGVAAAHNVIGAAIFARWAGSEPLPEDGGAAAPAAAAIAATGPAPAGPMLEAGGSDTRVQSTAHAKLE